MIHTLAPPCFQLELLSVPKMINAHNTASARNAYGMAAQEIVCEVLGLTHIPINGNYSICFDAFKAPDYYEIKSVKRGGKVVCYDWRMEKEAKSGVSLLYAVLMHSIAYARQDILSIMANAPITLIVLPARVVRDVASGSPLCAVPKTQAGYCRLGYCDGYRSVPVGKLLELATKRRVVNNPFGTGVITYAQG